MSLLVEMPDMGLNSLVPPSELDPRGADKFTQNIIYQYGLLQTPTGFAKVDLSSGLNSGDKVLAVFGHTEQDGADHTIAVTTETIQRHDTVNSEWDDITQSGVTMASDIWHPISWATVLHDDTDIYIDDDSVKANAYHHLIVCDGGMTNIQRWAGRYEADFGDVIMTDGDYGTGQTTHRALQVGTFKSRMLLISPQEYSSTSKTWVENNAQVRWPTIGKLQTWTGTGSGFANLLETNDTNVWSSLLGNQYIIYQHHNIWGLNYVGGDTVFSPLPVIKDLGLLSHHLMVSRGNCHYFVGDDFNVYQYFGGTVKIPIGDEIHKNLKEDLNPDYISRCWMVMSPKSEFLWIYIVPTGSTYITMAYGRNMLTGAWFKRDLTNKWGSGGITAVNLVGGQSYTVGETYATALNTLSAYDAADTTGAAGDVTEKYGDVLYKSTNQVLDWTELSVVADYDFSLKAGEVAFSAGGLSFCFSYANDPTKLVGDDTDYSGHILKYVDGSLSTNMPSGVHYYTLTDVCSVLDAGTDYSVTVHVQPCETTGTAIADASTDTPVLDGTSWLTIFDPSGETYYQQSEERETDDQIMYGDSAGYIYQDDADMTVHFDGDDMLCRHYTPIYDCDMPDIHKRWPGIAFVGKDSNVIVRYRMSNFDTSETGLINIFP